MAQHTKKWTRFIIPPLILIGGIAVMVGLTASRKSPPKSKPTFPGVLVDVQSAHRSDRQTFVRGHGTVKPRQEVMLSPQIPGKIDWVHPEFAAGGQFEEGEIIARVEQKDYQLAVDQAKAAVAGAEYGLAVAKANADIARNEWETMQKSRALLGMTTENKQPNGLVLHEPQLKQAEATLESAKAALAIAELRLERTEITAPFNCRIKSESIDPGQYVNTGSPIASIYSTDVAEIEVGIPMSEVLWIPIPGAKAIVSMELDGKKYTWDGRVDRNIGVIDERERLARVVVQVKNPFRKENRYSPELSVGAFVNVNIEGRVLDDIYALPRQTLRQNSTVWIASVDSLLEIRDVIVARLSPTEVLIQDGINEGDRVVLSSIAGAAQGLKLQPITSGAGK